MEDVRNKDGVSMGVNLEEVAKHVISVLAGHGVAIGDLKCVFEAIEDEIGQLPVRNTLG